ncbi:hypothetical protein BDY19DRAFT_588426 [Irpex rosettiformis]|uniref:Uncharacterized protein n=1 Tax=Irpex rosettiformis TaxID=378272 RepID=A0ACB8UDH9_9APHY|nr:hypothetical protein BDY19DRAFT_588426 [Irpex rosettiformis]
MPSKLLSSHFRTVFEDVLTPFQQLQAINSLKDYVFELEHGTDEQRRELDVLSDEDVDSDMVKRKVDAARERCYWQLIMFLRSSRPSRIAEAEPYVRVLLQSPSVVNDSSNFHRITANLHLAAALAASATTPQQFSYRHTSKLNQSQLDEALSLFSHSFTLYDTPASSALTPPIPSKQHGLGIYIPLPACVRRRFLPPKTELWARASYIRLLRTLGQDEEANRQLELIKAFIQSHPYALPTDRYCAFIKDLSLEFGLDLEVAEDDPIRLITPAESAPIADDCELASPVSPTLSTCSDSSTSSPPLTPTSVLPPAQAFSKDHCDTSNPDEHHHPEPSYLC